MRVADVTRRRNPHFPEIVQGGKTLCSPRRFRIYLELDTRVRVSVDQPGDFLNFGNTGFM